MCVQAIVSSCKKLVTVGVPLSLLILGNVSLAPAQTANLSGSFKVKEFCDSGNGGAERNVSKSDANIFVDLSEFPEIYMEITQPDEPLILGRGFAFAKNSKKGVFGVWGADRSLINAGTMIGTYKLDKNGDLRSIKGKYQNVYNGDGECVGQGKFKFSN